ncbi:serine hydrolase domain-containing protein [Actinoplanes utahensis]|nr:serine hydrolase [Actinoplanes utahensis]
MIMDSAPGIDRRNLVRWGGLAAAGVPLAAGLGHAGAAGAAPSPSWRDRLPPDTLPGGAYDRWLTRMASETGFSGVVLLAHRGRTVLSRSFGMADRERGIHNHEGIAFTLSSAGKPFNAIAVLQLAQQGRVKLGDPIGTYLTGFDPEIAEKVTVHHVLSGTSGLNTPTEDIERVFGSRQEVHEYYEQWARRSRPVAPPGTPSQHAGAEVAIPALIVEAVSGKTYWDYVEENIFRRCGMTGSGFFTRPQWLTDRHLAHPYMTVAGGEVDAIRNLDRGSSREHTEGRNPGRAFIDAPGDGGFATAPDLVRFARALRDGTLLERPWAEVLTAAKTPHGAASFGSYGIPVRIVNGQWVFGRAGANPGVGACWTIYPDSGWSGVILGNADRGSLLEATQQEMRAVTGAAPGGGSGG